MPASKRAQLVGWWSSTSLKTCATSWIVTKYVPLKRNVRNGDSWDVTTYLYLPQNVCNYITGWRPNTWIRTYMAQTCVSGWVVTGVVVVLSNDSTAVVLVVLFGMISTTFPPLLPPNYQPWTGSNHHPLSICWYSVLLTPCCCLVACVSEPLCCVNGRRISSPSVHRFMCRNLMHALQPALSDLLINTSQTDCTERWQLSFLFSHMVTATRLTALSVVCIYVWYACRNSFIQQVWIHTFISLFMCVTTDE